jgi:two-component sensor histidine kinase
MSHRINSIQEATHAGGQVPEDPSLPEEIAKDAYPSLLEAIMPALKAGLWEATHDSLRLISLNFGRSDHPMLSVSRRRMEEGVHWTDFVCPPDRDRVTDFLVDARSVGGGQSVEYRIIAGGGKLLWVRHHVLQRVPGPDGRIILRGLITAIEDQKRLERQCLRVSERECNRIGQDLHDDLCQVLAGLSYMMQVLARRAAKVDASLGSEIDELKVHVSDAVKRTRSMAHGLFPAQLKQGTLRQALRQLVREMKERFPATLSLDLSRTLPAHSPEQITQVYRIVQEAVTNSVRHGKATAVRIAAAVQSNGMLLMVEDNGRGLPAPPVRPTGIGMPIMRHRATILGGEIKFADNSPKGAVVQLSYPIAVLRYRRKAALQSS